jgi:hypothetical protein
MRTQALLALLLLIGAGPAMAQTSGQVTNPLRPSAQPRAAQQAETPAAPAPRAERPKRERSEAQKRNDQIMRDCGQEWRANKPALQAKGMTWLAFSKDCRAKRRTQQGV